MRNQRTERATMDAPACVNRTVGGRLPNSAYRPREYLTPDELGKLQEAAKQNRWGHRDALMLQMVYVHGLRACELVTLQWSQVEMDAPRARLHVRRAKKGNPAVHDIPGDELRALRKLQREQQPASPYVFVSERGRPFTTAGFARMVERLGVSAGFEFPIHAHMLRHGTGYALVNKGIDTRAIQDYLGHRSIVHTCRYTTLSPERFRGFFE